MSEETFEDLAPEQQGFAKHIRVQERLAHEIKTTRLGLRDIQRPTGSELNQTTEKALAAFQQAEEAVQAVEAATVAAAAATQAAADAAATASGKNARRRGKTQPEPPAGGWTPGDQWVVENDAGTPVAVKVWNGSEFVDDVLLADSVLVAGEDGTVRLADGTVTAQTLNANALNFQTASGMNIYGAHIEGAEIKLADVVEEHILLNYNGDTTEPLRQLTFSFLNNSEPVNATIMSDDNSDGNFARVHTSEMFTLEFLGSATFGSYVEARIRTESPESEVSLYPANSEQFLASENKTVSGTTDWKIYKIPVLDREMLQGVHLYATNTSYIDIDYVRLVTQIYARESGISLSRAEDNLATLTAKSEARELTISGGGISLKAAGEGDALSILPHSIGKKNATISFGFDGSVNIENTLTENGKRVSTAEPATQQQVADGSPVDAYVTPDKLKAVGQKTLWSSVGSQMVSSSTITLSEPISQQMTGIVLVFSRYANGAATNNYWNYCFVPKWHATANQPGFTTFSLATGTNVFGLKNLTITDTTISGIDSNNTAPNNAFVLRRVLGV